MPFVIMPCCCTGGRRYAFASRSLTTPSTGLLKPMLLLLLYWRRRKRRNVAARIQGEIDRRRGYRRPRIHLLHLNERKSFKFSPLPSTSLNCPCVVCRRTRAHHRRVAFVVCGRAAVEKNHTTDAKRCPHVAYCWRKFAKIDCSGGWRRCMGKNARNIRHSTQIQNSINHVQFDWPANNRLFWSRMNDDLCDLCFRSIVAYSMLFLYLWALSVI